MSDRELIESALRARRFSYSPYSHFAVGAALLTKSGKVFTGCNIESAAYSPTVCAERTAVYKAVSEGERAFAAIAIVAGRAEETDVLLNFAAPCGVCRQVLSEFDGGDLRILLAKSPDEFRVYTLGELFPLRFSAEGMR